MGDRRHRDRCDDRAPFHVASRGGAGSRRPRRRFILPAGQQQTAESASLRLEGSVCSRAVKGPSLVRRRDRWTGDRTRAPEGSDLSAHLASLERVGDEMRLAEVRLRPTLRDPDERDDAKEMLKVAIASIQRERSFADQCYTRGRNAFAVSATLFTAAQAAFISSVGRQLKGEPLLKGSEKSQVLIPAAVGAVLLVVALALLIFWLDRPRKMVLVGSRTLWDIWLNKSGRYDDTPVLEALVVEALHEESAWAAANRDRRRALMWSGIVSALAGVAGLIQVYVLYCNL